MYLNPPLTAKNGKLLVLIIVRISTLNQDVRSLLAQEDFCKKYVRDHYDGEIEFVVISSQGSGERLDRAELVRAEELIESGSLDLVIAEDLGRIMRRTRVIDFCEVCEDADTRLIAINDRLDTREKKWRRSALWAAMKHEESNEDTSDRIRRQMDHNFSTLGGCLNHVVWGLVKPLGSKADAALTWDPRARKLLRVAWWKLEHEPQLGISGVARWVRGQTGGETLSFKKFWRLIRDPIVTGMRRRGVHRSKRTNSSGKRSGKLAAVEQIMTRFCPHLRIIRPERFVRVLQLLTERNAHYKRGKDGIDPLKGRPKRETRFPGQCLTCGVCGRYFCWGGHGQTDHLVCGGVRDYRCWNTATIDGPLAAKRIGEAVIERIVALDGFDDTFGTLLKEQLSKSKDIREAKLHELDQRRRKLQREIENMTDALRRSAASAILLEEVARLDAARKSLDFEIHETKRCPVRQVKLPDIDELRERVRRAFVQLIEGPSQVPFLARQLLSSVELHPHRLCDGGATVQRAEVCLNLVPLVAGAKGINQLEERLTVQFMVDLFTPPQRAAIRKDVMNTLRDHPEMTYGELAKSLEPRHGFITDTAVQRAVKLSKLMALRGLDDPYIPLAEPIAGHGRQRMHLHPDYRFEPLAGFNSKYVTALPEPPRNIPGAGGNDVRLPAA